MVKTSWFQGQAREPETRFRESTGFLPDQLLLTTPDGVRSAQKGRDVRPIALWWAVVGDAHPTNY
ncbi:MAG: hypothetical protein GDA38_00035 [Hormoscilla sp. SP12CHS1]|nr:hypothetical protein [Hormoscilla sp. SP12CHS1]